MTTMENKIKLMMLYVRQTTSAERSPAGNIKSAQHHTPSAQERLISFDDLRRIIFWINGIFQNGRTIDPTSPITSIQCMFIMLMDRNEFFELADTLMDLGHRQRGCFFHPKTLHVERRHRGRVNKRLLEFTLIDLLHFA